MPLHLRSPKTLTDAERTAWDQVQCADKRLDSPYFRPEWCDAAAAVGRPVEIAVWTNSDGQPVAFLPYEHDGRHAHPVGRMVSDYQAVIALDDAPVQVDAFLNEANLTAFHFDHWLADQASFAAYHEQHDESPYIDLSNGLEDYQASLSKSGKSDASTARRKGRKLGREVGELRFTWHNNDASILESLVEWKRHQYDETGVPDVFAHDWTRDLLTHLHGLQTDNFAGVLTTLHAGDHLVAVHMGMRSRGVLHWWFPTYDRAFSDYSPGRVLLQHLIDHGPEHGITKIDLGKGMSSYKRRTMSAATPLAVGVVEHASVKRFVRQSAHAAKAWLKKTPLRGPLSVPGRWLHHVLSRRAMQ